MKRHTLAHTHTHAHIHILTLGLSYTCFFSSLSLSLFLCAAASLGPCPMLPPPGIVWSGREKRARFLITSRLCFPCFARLFVQRTRFALHCRHCPQSSCPMHRVIRWKKLIPPLSVLSSVARARSKKGKPALPEHVSAPDCCGATY